MPKPSFSDHLTRLQAKGKLKRPNKKLNKVKKVMHEFKHGTLHSGSKTGPKVKNRKQAIAIGLSEQRRARAGKY